MNCCDYNQCNQGRNCPARAPAKVATAKPLYRRCDSGGPCPKPDAQCQAECLLSADYYGEPISKTGEALMWLILTLAVGLLLVLTGGALGYIWGML